MRKFLAPLWIPLLLLLLALSGAWGALRLQDSLENYRPPDLAALTETAGPARVTEPLTRRLVLVVIDGLREDVSRQMPFLNQLRQEGAAGISRAGQPSYSKPGYAVISSGAWQEVTGVTMNSHQGPLRVETIFQLAKKAGLKTAMVADEWWGELNGPGIDFDYNYRDADSHDPATDEKTYLEAIKSLRQERADLTLIHFCQVDTQGHAAGGGSQEYRAAALHIDQFLKGIVGTLDLNRDTIIVTSDHGHLTRNNGGGSGHGGWEKEVVTSPLVLAGAGIRPLTTVEAEQADLAPTMAALLGLRAPAQSQGRILWPVLEVSPRSQMLLELARLKLNYRFTVQYLEAVGSRLTPTRPVPMPPWLAVFEKGESAKTSPQEWLALAEKKVGDGELEAAFAAARQGNEQLRLLVEAAKRERWEEGRWLRLWSPLFLFGAFYWLRQQKERPWFWPFLIGLVGFVALDTSFYLGVWHNTYSLGVFPDASLGTFFKLFGWPAYLALVPIIGYWWVIAPRWKGPDLFGRAQLVEIILLAAALSQVAIFLLAYYWEGFPISWPLPDFRLGFLEMSALLHLVFLGPLGIILPPLAGLWGMRERHKNPFFGAR